MHEAKEESFKRQDEILERSIALARNFNTDKIRCFDFWRLEDVTPYRAAIDEKLRSAAETAGRHGLLLVLENEFECNTATGREAARTLNAIQTPCLALNCNRIHHCHVDNAVKTAAGKVEWAQVGKGVIDWTGQFRALKQSGYRGAVSLETHWHGAATPEESTGESWRGMKRDLLAAGCE